MNGELDFNESLVERVKCLAGADESVFEEVYQVIQLTPGAEEFVWALRTMGYKIAVVSGGFNRARSQKLPVAQTQTVCGREGGMRGQSALCAVRKRQYTGAGGDDGIAKM